MKKFVSMLLCAALLTACGHNQQQQQHRSLNTMEVNPADITVETAYSAAVEGKQDISIMPQVSGFITKLCVSEGQHVRRGQQLFEIDRVNFEAALRMAEANLEAAEAAVATNQLTFDSKQKLYDEKVISRYDLQVAQNALLTARAQLAQAQAGVTNARQNLSYTSVVSPCDGVVGRLPMRVGTLVSPQMPTPLTTISDNSEMYVYFSMTEAQMLSLISRYGSVEAALAKLPDVSLRLCDGSLYAHQGRIESISGVIDKQTGAVSVRAVFPNPDRLLLSGGSCNVLISQERQGVLLIPQAATYEIQDKTYAFTVADGKAQSVLIDVTPTTDGRSYIVNSGLAAGQRIIAEGAGLVHDGDSVD